MKQEKTPTDQIVKKILLFFVSFFLGGTGIVMLKLQILSFFSCFLFFIGFLFFGMIWSIINNKKAFIPLLPLLFIVFGSFFTFSPEEKTGLLFFTFGSLISFFIFFKNYKEKISFSFFSEGLTAIRRGMLFFVLSFVFLSLGNTFSLPNKDVAHKILTSPSYTQIIEELSNNESLQESLKEKILQDISEQCKGNQECIHIASQNALPEIKKTIKEQIHSTLRPYIEKFSHPQELRKFLAEQNIPLLSPLSSDLSGEHIILLFLGIIILLILSPFFGLFSFLIALPFFALMTFLKYTPIISCGKKDVTKDILY